MTNTNEITDLLLNAAHAHPLTLAGYSAPDTIKTLSPEYEHFYFGSGNFRFDAVFPASNPSGYYACILRSESLTETIHFREEAMQNSLFTCCYCKLQERQFFIRRISDLVTLRIKGRLLTVTVAIAEEFCTAVDNLHSYYLDYKNNSDYPVPTRKEEVLLYPNW